MVNHHGPSSRRCRLRVSKLVQAGGGLKASERVSSSIPCMHPSQSRGGAWASRSSRGSGPPRWRGLVRRRHTARAFASVLYAICSQAHIEVDEAPRGLFRRKNEGDALRHARRRISRAVTPTGATTLDPRRRGRRPPAVPPSIRAVAGDAHRRYHPRSAPPRATRRMHR
jgi:hypothetical protein